VRRGTPKISPIKSKLVSVAKGNSDWAMLANWRLLQIRQLVGYDVAKGAGLAARRQLPDAEKGIPAIFVL